MNIPVQFYDLFPAFNSVAAESADESTSLLKIGYVVLAIIVSPVIILFIASLFSHPRIYRIQIIHFGSIILLAGALIVGFAVIGWVLKFFVPQ